MINQMNWLSADNISSSASKYMVTSYKQALFHKTMQPLLQIQTQTQIIVLPLESVQERHQ